MRSPYPTSAVRVALGVVAWGVLQSGTAALGQTPAEKSLYERLGGYEAISAVVNDFAEKLFTDPQVGRSLKPIIKCTWESCIKWLNPLVKPVGHLLCMLPY